MIVITVNGKQEELPESTSITDLLIKYGVKPETVVVELNYEIPERQSWADIKLVNEDHLEIVKFIGGG
ncbi:MAG: sulfur carrier protein ThiS [Syntrophomonadaceae bacterium]|nr:sulfur carrier protein ThiS [Syntrophomonadaceae bacterium]